MYSILKSVKVLDLTKVFSGPIATRFLADYGAKVVKIESQHYPDPARNFSPLVKSWSGYFELLNRNKESITIDLKNDKDLQIFYDLVKKSDVVVENFSSSVKRELKIDYKSLKKHNISIIYASLSGIDQVSNRKYFDVIAQAESGLMSLSGSKKPMKIGPAIIDAYSGMQLALGIVTALYNREKTGKGSVVEVSMLGSAINLLENNIIETSITRKNPNLPGNYDNALSPFGIYSCKDGEVVIAIGNDRQWKVFANEFKLNIPEYETNEKRLINSKRLTIEIKKTFKNHTKKKLINILNEINIPCARIRNMKDVLSDPWMYSSNSLIKVKSKYAGNYVTTGYSINFKNEKKGKDYPAPKLGKNNKDYGI